MKSIVKISGIVAVSVLYCTVIYFVYGFSNNQASCFPNQQDTNKETSYYGVPDNQNGYALPVKISLSTQILLLNTSSSFSNKISVGRIKSVEQTLSKAINRYIFQSADFPIRLRKKDILFPFQYFW